VTGVGKTAVGGGRDRGAGTSSGSSSSPVARGPQCAQASGLQQGVVLVGSRGADRRVWQTRAVMGAPERAASTVTSRLSEVAGRLPRIAAQQALIDLAPPLPHCGGYVPRHGGATRRKNSMTTSLKLRVDERELLERLAVEQDICLAEVWRRALRAYASEVGLSTQPGGSATQQH
jgi:hypothetical protein